MDKPSRLDKSSPSDQAVAPRSLLNSSALVSVMTMLSRVMGLVRDIVIARLIGAGGYADAFFVAFKIPQFLRRLFAEGAFAQAFVPVLSEYRQRYEAEGNVAAIKSLINAVCGVLGGTLFMLVSLVVLAAPVVTALFAPGFIDQPEKFAMTQQMLRITFPYLLLISLTGFAGAILNSYDRFVVPAFTPVLLNLSLIGFALFATPLFSAPVYALAWAVLFAGVLQWLFQLPFLAQIDRMPKPKWDLQHAGVKKILILMVPAIFGVSVSQINLLLDTVLASFLPTGSVSWLYYSDRLAELPLGVFGIAIATVILPGLSRLQLQNLSDDGEGSNEKFVSQFKETLNWALRCITTVALPATAALIVLAAPILFALFQYQAMTAEDVAMSTYSLRAYALGLIAFMAIKVLATGFYAQQDMKTPVRIGIIAMVSNMVLNLILVLILHHYWQLGHVGLALATSLSAVLNAGLLFRGLSANRHLCVVSEGGKAKLLSADYWRLLLQVIFAVAAMVAVLIWLQPELSFWASADWLSHCYRLSVLCIAGFATYLIALLLLGVKVQQFKAPQVA
ncbi:MAG: murein biosynthesis integral membrane protein MurJ [Pseudomonadales bacterium]|nr:murein biosynthesis integral membrane protein MurJ [Pseudomonadales bacterium]